MRYTRTWSLLAVTALVLAWSACTPEWQDPSEGPDTDVADTGVVSDAGDEGPLDVGETDADDASAADATDAAPDVVDTVDAPDPEPDVPPPTPDDWECDPDFVLDAERYTDLEEAEGQGLVDGLHQRVAGHHDRGYDAAREFMFEELEVREDGKLECVYTAQRVAPDGTNEPGGQFNTEHTWPQSRGADTEPARSDVHHLFPANMEANNARANYKFGHVDCDESTCPWHEGGSFLGPSADDNRDPIFEVRPERRGDVARVILYFSLRYEEPISAKEEAVLRTWNCEDPPDEYEQSRNDDIEDFQQNRNPFIDRPDFVDRIEAF